MFSKWCGSIGAADDIVVRRDRQELTLHVTPSGTELTDRFGNHHQIGLLGIARPALRKA